MSPRITESQWLEELAKLTKKRNDPGLSAREMSEKSGMTMLKVRELLQAAKRAGRLTLGFRDTTRIDGRKFMETVYRVEPVKLAIASRHKRR